MTKIKSGFLLLGVIFFANVLQAQTIEEGRKFLYYERHESAKSVFEKLLAANPNDLDALYWLGQSMLTDDEEKDIAGAKALYQKALMANSNSPLLIAGMGHIELLEGKTQDARNRFETALSLSQSKNIQVLNAIGFANIDAKSGDLAYAVDKLTIATTLKGMKDPEVFMNLGNAYKKQTEGGNAQKSYESALALNPNYAAALYRIGKIYQTQGINQEELYMKYYNDAISKDPAYGPVYENLYQYYYLTDVGKSAAYLEKYLSNTDNDPKNCYYRASMKYAQGLFAECIAKVDECVKEVTDPYPNLFGLKGYAYNKLNDSMNAKAAFEDYFQKQKPEKIGPTDLETYAKILLKIPGNEALAGTYIDKAVLIDSTENGKVALLKSMAVNYETKKMYKEAADWYNKIVIIRKETRKTDLFNAGNNYSKAGDYKTSVNVFDQYIQKFPVESFGYFMNAKNFLKIDSADSEGKAINYYNKIIGMTDQIKDKPGEKDRIKVSLRYMIEFYANVKRNKDSSLFFCDKAIELDSTDMEFKNIRDIISKANLSPSKSPVQKDGKSAAPKTPGTKPDLNKQNATKEPEAKKK